MKALLLVSPDDISSGILVLVPEDRAEELAESITQGNVPELQKFMSRQSTKIEAYTDPGHFGSIHTVLLFDGFSMKILTDEMRRVMAQ